MARRPTNPTVHQALNAFTKTKPNHRTKSTSKLVMYAHDGEPFGVVLSDEDCNALSADELREAVKNYVHCFVRCPDGHFEMIAYDDYQNWDFVDAVVAHHQGGAFEVVEIVNTEKEQIERIQREYHVSRADAATMFGWWYGKRVP